MHLAKLTACHGDLKLKSTRSLAPEAGISAIECHDSRTLPSHDPDHNQCNRCHEPHMNLVNAVEGGGGERHGVLKLESTRRSAHSAGLSASELTIEFFK